MRNFITISLIICMFIVSVGCSQNEIEPGFTRIPDKSELYIQDDFPDLSDKTVCEKKDYNWSYYVFRVVSVKDDNLYLASTTSTVSRYILYGSFG